MSRKVCAVAAGGLSLLMGSLIAAPLDAATRSGQWESRMVIAGDNTGGGGPVNMPRDHRNSAPRSNRRSGGVISSPQILVAGNGNAHSAPRRGGDRYGTTTGGGGPGS